MPLSGTQVNNLGLSTYFHSIKFQSTARQSFYFMQTMSTMSTPPWKLTCWGLTTVKLTHYQFVVVNTYTYGCLQTLLPASSRWAVCRGRWASWPQGLRETSLEDQNNDSFKNLGSEYTCTTWTAFFAEWLTSIVVLIVRYLPYLLWTGCNSRPQNHFGSGGMGSGTEQQQQQQRSWKKEGLEFTWKYTITTGHAHLPTRNWDSPSSSGRETWPRPAAARSCWF